MAGWLTQAMKQWVAEHRGSGKLEQIWGFAGISGGGGVLNVASHEELDRIMIRFPFGAWSHIEVYALTDIDETIAEYERFTNEMIAMAGQMPQPE